MSLQYTFYYISSLKMKILPHSKIHGFWDPHHRDTKQHVVANLHGLAWTDGATVDDVLSHTRKHGFGSGELFLGSSHHESQRGGLSTNYSFRREMRNSSEKMGKYAWFSSIQLSLFDLILHLLKLECQGRWTSWLQPKLQPLWRCLGQWCYYPCTTYQALLSWNRKIAITDQTKLTKWKHGNSIKWENFFTWRLHFLQHRPPSHVGYWVTWWWWYQPFLPLLQGCWPLEHLMLPI